MEPSRAVEPRKAPPAAAPAAAALPGMTAAAPSARSPSTPQLMRSPTRDGILTPVSLMNRLAAASIARQSPRKAAQTPARSAHVTPEKEGRGSRRRSSAMSNSGLSERRPVNEKAAGEARAACCERSAALLASYRKIKANTRARLLRRYYDKWQRFPTQPTPSTTIASTDPITPSRAERATQTERLWGNGDIESCSPSPSPPHRARGGAIKAAREVVHGSDDMGRALSWGNEASPMGPTPPGPRPVFQFSPQPPPKEGIAARSRPAGHLDDVKKPVLPLPRRKGRSPPRLTPSVGLPGVVESPIRVYRK